MNPRARGSEWILVCVLAAAFGCAPRPQAATPVAASASFTPITSPDSPLLDRTSMGVLVRFRESIASVRTPGLLDPASQPELAEREARDAACVTRLENVPLEGTGHGDERATWLLAGDRAVRRILPLALDASLPKRAAELRALPAIDDPKRAEAVVGDLREWIDEKAEGRVSAQRNWWPSEWSSQWGPRAAPPDASMSDYGQDAIARASETFVFAREPRCVSPSGAELDCAEPTAEEIQDDAERAVVVLAEDAMHAGAPPQKVYEALCATFGEMVERARRGRR